MQKVRWGVLGAARIATVKVIPAMQKGEFCEIAAIASRDRARAEETFNQALELGRDQSSLSWQLRTTLSLARLRVQEHRSRDARELVRAIYEVFTEGFQTRDLLEARALIN